jgi:hypothetical protein
MWADNYFVDTGMTMRKLSSMEFQYLYGRLTFSPRALLSAQNLWRKQSLKTSESASLARPTLPISPVLGFDRYCMELVRLLLVQVMSRMHSRKALNDSGHL